MTETVITPAPTEAERAEEDRRTLPERAASGPRSRLHAVRGERAFPVYELGAADLAIVGKRRAADRPQEPRAPPG